MSKETYYATEDLAKFGETGKYAPELWDKFLAYYGDVTGKAGALTVREKALIALAVATVEQCPYCIDAYTHTCLENGADSEQMTEAIHVAAAMKAGTALAHSVQMRNITDKIEL